MASAAIDLYSLLGRAPDDAHVALTVDAIARRTAAFRSPTSTKQEQQQEVERLLTSERKSFSDATYNLYPHLGLSLSFHPKERTINQIDLTSPVPALLSSVAGSLTTTGPSPSSPTPGAPRPLPPFALSESSALPSPLHARSDLLELLAALGEPSRKGGGLENVGRLGPGVWVEWADVGRAMATMTAKGGGIASPSPTAAAAAAAGNSSSPTSGSLNPPPLPPSSPSPLQPTEKRGLYVEFEVRGAGCWERSSLEGERWKSATLFLS